MLGSGVDRSRVFVGMRVTNRTIARVSLLVCVLLTGHVAAIPSTVDTSRMAPLGRYAPVSAPGGDFIPVACCLRGGEAPVGRTAGPGVGVGKLPEASLGFCEFCFRALRPSARSVFVRFLFPPALHCVTLIREFSDRG